MQTPLSRTSTPKNSPGFWKYEAFTKSVDFLRGGKKPQVLVNEPTALHAKLVVLKILIKVIIWNSGFSDFNSAAPNVALRQSGVL